MRLQAVRRPGRHQKKYHSSVDGRETELDFFFHFSLDRQESEGIKSWMWMTITVALMMLQLLHHLP
jgi:hypothetical protein